MPNTAVQTAPKAGLTLDEDGLATITLTHPQLMALETFAAQPQWPDAVRDAVRVLRELEL